MRVVMIALLPVLALGFAASAANPVSAPFQGSWQRCDTYRGDRVCSYALTTQRGNRVCGVESYFASGRLYYLRFVGTAEGSSVRIDKICGRPGSETDTHCADQAPRYRDSTEKVGWGTSTDMRHVCKGRLHEGRRGKPFSCATAVRDAGIPKVRRLTTDDGLEAEQRAWLASCTAGRE
ncbi:hypothetical protein [Sphingopyxis sp. 2PD]|uniref:hypothetical protein n=1 Tax=Sphingopyxis sp. 2PD TaxID=2502196 RepID=UPI0010F85E20|nr:hypothetical protein [Sphingopyxis sp. 2PD]